MCGWNALECGVAQDFESARQEIRGTIQSPLARGGRLLGPGTRPPPPPLRAHLVTKGQWLLAIHRGNLGQSLNPRLVAWCIMVTPGVGFEF